MNRSGRQVLLTVAAFVLVGFAAVDLDRPLVVNTTGDGADTDLDDGNCLTDSGVCSLRAAMETANAEPDFDRIHFAIPDSDPGYDADNIMSTLVLTSPLPTISEPVAIEGESDPRYSEVDRHPTISIKAAAAAADDPVLHIAAAESTVSSVATVGGRPGILIAADHVSLDGVAVGGSAESGIQILGAGSAAITNSWVGVDWLGRPTPNADSGIILDKFAADNTVADSVIAFNGGSGVAVEVNAKAGNAVVSTTMYENGGLAIDLRLDGVTANDDTDADSGPNDLLNYPEVVSAVSSTSETRVALELPPLPGTYLIELFTTDAPDPSGHGELDVFFGRAEVTVVEAGQMVSVTGPPLPGPDHFVVATATQCRDVGCADYGSTSEAAPVRTIDINLAPILSLTDLTSSIGDEIAATLDGSDPEAGPLSWTASGLPPDIELVGNTLTGTISSSAAGQEYSVVVSATDDVGNVSDQTFTWRVEMSTVAPTTSVTTTSSTTAPATTSATAVTTTASPTTTTTSPTTAASSTAASSTVAPPTTAASLGTGAPAQEPEQGDQDDDTDQGSPDELAAVDESSRQADAALRLAAVELIRRSPDDPVPLSPSSPRSSSGLLIVLAGLAEMVDHSRPPIWPIALALIAACSFWLVLRLYTTRSAYMVHPDATVTAGSQILPPGSGPFWGRSRIARRAVVKLESPFGITDVDTGSLIELEGRLSADDHLW